MKRYFNTSGPNNPEEHYTLMRPDLIRKGIDLVNRSRYFTIWAPRQTGKSTYFRLLAEELKKKDYKTAHINVENFQSASESGLIEYITRIIKEQTGLGIKATDFLSFFNKLQVINNCRFVFVIDEIEGINPGIFGQFLHTIRNLYHSRQSHCLKSVIMVGISNIVGIIQDKASPFNIADNLDISYFSENEVYELLHQHEQETQQLFAQKVKEKIAYITAGQPGLVNGFAWKIVEENPDKQKITYDDYLEVEDWYLTEAIDKNIANIINKASQYRYFVEGLLFEEKKVSFEIDRQAIKVLHTNGIIRKNSDKNVEFWVPLYKKRLYKAFYPYSNGEITNISETLIVRNFFNEKGEINFVKFITDYKEYVKRRSFKPFREKDENGNYISIKEAALLYSFETYIQAFVREAKGKTYREADTGLGKSDLIINIKDNEFVIEAKKYYSLSQFIDGKEQLAYYCKSLGLKQSIYLVFIKNSIKYPEEVIEQTEKIKNIEIKTFLIIYDEEKDF